MSGAPQTMPTFAYNPNLPVLDAAISGASQGLGRDAYYGAIDEVAKDHGGVEGKFAKGYFDALAPGTSQWERLGKPAPGGDSGSAAMQAANQRKMAELQRANQRELQDRELATRLEVARLNANAQVKVAEIGSGPGHRQAAMGEQRLPVEQEQRKVETDLSRIKQLTEMAGLDRIGAEITSLLASGNWRDSATAINALQERLLDFDVAERKATFGDRVAAAQLENDQAWARLIREYTGIVADIVTVGAGGILGGKLLGGKFGELSKKIFGKNADRVIEGFSSRRR